MLLLPLTIELQWYEVNNRSIRREMIQSID